MMRSGIVGFVFGIVWTFLALFLVQIFLIRPMAGVSGAFSYHFDSCVFDQVQFPSGDLDNGRMLRRALLPIVITTRYYDAQYHEVSQADKPGRYGAIVRIEVDGVVVHRFVTLYRTPVKIFWGQSPLPILAEFPAEAGVNPAVLRTQQPEIGEALKNSLVDEIPTGGMDFSNKWDSLRSTIIWSICRKITMTIPEKPGL
jgi:hypothetical protein